MIGGELCGRVARIRGAFLFLPPLIRRNTISIHETGMNSRELFYLVVIRTDLDKRNMVGACIWGGELEMFESI